MVLYDDGFVIWFNYFESLDNNRVNCRFKLICNILLVFVLWINELFVLMIDDLDFENFFINVSKILMWKIVNKKDGIKGEVICKVILKIDVGNCFVFFFIIEKFRDFYYEMNKYFELYNRYRIKLIFFIIYGNYMCDRNERIIFKKRLVGFGLLNYGFYLFWYIYVLMLFNVGINWKEF